MPVITGSAAATVAAEAMAAKKVETSMRVARKALRGMNLITSAGERDLEASDIARGAMLLKPTISTGLERAGASGQVRQAGKAFRWTELPTVKNPEIKRPDLEQKGLEGVDRFRGMLSTTDLPHSRIWDAFLARREQMTKLERHPGKMARETAVRISKIAPSNREWKYMTPAKRLDTLRRCYSIMGEEACLPKELVENTKITMKDIPGCNAQASLFVEEGESQSWSACETAPTITISEQNLKNPNYDFISCVSSLYHETMHVLQQQCLLESGDTIPYPEWKKEWAEALRKHANGTDNYDDGLGYLTSAMEIHSIQQQELFRRMLRVCASEGGR